MRVAQPAGNPTLCCGVLRHTPHVYDTLPYRTRRCGFERRAQPTRGAASLGWERVVAMALRDMGDGAGFALKLS